jgi:hypothetical protein
LLLDHFLWKLIRVQLLPSPDAERYAVLMIEQYRSVPAKTGKLYSFVTGNKWNKDLTRIGYSGLNNLLQSSGVIRNAFVHQNPLAGHEDPQFADQLRLAVPDLFDLFVKLANEYHCPRAKLLSRERIVEE